MRWLCPGQGGGHHPTLITTEPRGWLCFPFLLRLSSWQLHSRRGRNYEVHFTDEEAEAQRQTTCTITGLHAKFRQNLGFWLPTRGTLCLLLSQGLQPALGQSCSLSVATYYPGLSQRLNESGCPQISTGPAKGSRSKVSLGKPCSHTCFGPVPGPPSCLIPAQGYCSGSRPVSLPLDGFLRVYSPSK